jgi:hypothetical protein
MSAAETVILTLVGAGIIAVGVMILMQLRSGAAVARPAPQEVVVQRIDPWFYYGRRGPYYAHLPVRPIVY